MRKNVAMNAKQFAKAELKTVFGALPKQIKGQYFRNGPGLLTVRDSILQHWFVSPGYVVSLDFRDGKVWGQGKFIRSPCYQRALDQGLTYKGIIKESIKNFIYKSHKETQNPLNTSMMPLRDSPTLLALCENSLPYKLQKTTLLQKGYQNFEGSLEGAFSAHPKVDPDSGDIFNLGCNIENGTFNLVHLSKSLKMVKQQRHKMRYPQSIHDICLAGDYLVVFETPVIFSPLKILSFNNYFDSCQFDVSRPTLIRVFSKGDFNLVREIQTEGFASYHFTNGFSEGSTITLEYFAYKGANAAKLFAYVRDFPKIAAGQSIDVDLQSVLEEAKIDLSNGTVVHSSQLLSGQFPVCQDSLVGKPWRYTYFSKCSTNQFYMDSLCKYDRQEKQVKVFKLEEGTIMGEPALLRAGGQNYLLSLTTHHQKSFATLLDDDLRKVAEFQLPQLIPHGFHGKWDQQ